LAKDFITGGQDYVGVRVPAHTVALSLLKEFEEQGGYGIAAPSANRFGKVSPTSAAHVQEELSNYLKPTDLILDGGQSSVGVESTIINCIQNFPTILRPGAVTAEMISNLLDLSEEIVFAPTTNKVKASGLLESHYSPLAKVFLSGIPKKGDGFIALASYPTPPGAIRLASPIDNNEYARVLYQGLRTGDRKNLEKIFVILPTGDDIAVAICDRLKKAATKN
jgi:L-threonylcarbamoyladenylate synthase